MTKSSGHGDLRLWSPAPSIIFKTDQGNINRTRLCNFGSNSFYMRFALWIVILRQKLRELEKIYSLNKLLPMNPYSPRLHSYTGWALYCTPGVGGAFALGLHSPLKAQHSRLCVTTRDVNEVPMDTRPRWRNSWLTWRITLWKHYILFNIKKSYFKLCSLA